MAANGTLAATPEFQQQHRLLAHAVVVQPSFCQFGEVRYRWVRALAFDLDFDRWKSQFSVVAGPGFEPAAEPVGDSLNQEMHSLFPCSNSLFIV